MAIYDITFSLTWRLLTPIKKRTALFLAWGLALLSPLQWLRDLFFVQYADGSIDGNYNAGLTYAKGARVKFTDKSLYEALFLVPLATPPTNELYWVKVQDIWIGLRERMKYSSQKLLFEYALNKYFATTFRQPDDELTPTPSDIYIENIAQVNDVFVVGGVEEISSVVYLDEVNAIDYIRITYAFDTKSFNINIPTAVYNALGVNKVGIVSQFVNKYALAGTTYTITPY